MEVLNQNQTKKLRVIPIVYPNHHNYNRNINGHLRMNNSASNIREIKNPKIINYSNNIQSHNNVINTNQIQLYRLVES